MLASVSNLSTLPQKTSAFVARLTPFLKVASVGVTAVRVLELPEVDFGGVWKAETF